MWLDDSSNVTWRTASYESSSSKARRYGFVRGPEARSRGTEARGVQWTRSDRPQRDKPRWGLLERVHRERTGVARPQSELSL